MSGTRPRPGIGSLQVLLPPLASDSFSPSSSAGETTPPSWRFAEAGAVAGRSRADSATAPNNARSHPPNFGSNNMAPPLDTCHDCRGRAGSATTKTMVPQTQLERAAPKPRTRVRTGCTQCLKHGRRCYAHRHACAAGVSENWEINKDLETNAATAVQRLQSPGSIGAAWTGRNWRERYSLHFYADFITSSNGRADYSDFWRQGLLQTSFQEPAILHGLVAIGALYEKNLRAKSGGYEVAKYNKSITEFAMAQFDRAIQCIRMSSYNNPNQQDPRITLAVCLLSAHFLNLQGLVEEAIEHGRMTLGLLQACKRGASRSSCALPLDCLEPAVRRVYTLAMSGTKATRAAIIRAASTNTESAPHGEVLEVSISSLGDAEENLHQILCRIRAIKDKRSAPEPSDEIAQVYETLKIRLDMWEDEFSNFLTRDGGSLNKEAFRYAQILKANHIFATILVNMDKNKTEPYHGFVKDFRAIMRLIAGSYDNTVSKEDFLYSNTVMGVYEPLFLTIDHCPDSEIRRQALAFLPKTLAIERQERMT